uniref:Uncharacterized protein n=1 Tax=Parascaris univalens TaxID=6257 RepID=A0A915A4X3_PARUN
MQKCLEGIRQSCAFVDMTFRTLYDRRLYNRAFVQQDIPGFAGLGLPVAYSDEHRFRLQSVRLHRRCCRSPSRIVNTNDANMQLVCHEYNFSMFRLRLRISSLFCYLDGVIS